MEDGTKKAGGIAIAALVAIGGLAVRTMDSCAGVGARSAARLGDDVARVGVQSGDELGHLGRFGDDLARTGDDIAGPSRYDLRGGRTGASFGGAAFADEAALADDALALGDEATLGDEAIEGVADVVIDVAPDAIQFMTDDDEDEPRAWPVRGPQLDVTDVRVIALSDREVATADRTVTSLAALEQSFRDGLAVDLIVARDERGRIRGARGEARSEEAILMRAAQLGRPAVLLVCRTSACMNDAARVASIAAELGPLGLAERLVVTRDRVAPRAGITLHRLHAGGGGVQLATSEPLAR